MFATWYDIDRGISALEQLRRGVGHNPKAAQARCNPARTSSSAGALNIFDTGTEFVVKVALPGVKNEDTSVTLEHDLLTIRAKRDTKVAVPEGFRAATTERSSWEYSRSFNITTPIEADAISAKLEDGILTVTLPRAKSQSARQIQVN